jgi:hypothetical protein
VGANPLRTLEQKNKERDKRLQKNYGWTLERRTRLAEKQGNRCAICGRPEGQSPLQMDHYHFKVSAVACTHGEPKTGLSENGLVSLPYGHGWIAVAHLPHKMLPWRWARAKTDAIRLAKEDALPHSVRGLLCPGRHGTGCNTKLGRADNIEFLEKALAYLKNPPAHGIE